MSNFFGQILKIFFRFCKMHHAAMPRQYCEICVFAEWQIQGAASPTPWNAVPDGKYCAFLPYAKAIHLFLPKRLTFFDRQV
jgi:hypothetical protein